MDIALVEIESSGIALATAMQVHGSVSAYRIAPKCDETAFFTEPCAETTALFSNGEINSFSIFDGKTIVEESLLSHRAISRIARFLYIA